MGWYSEDTDYWYAAESRGLRKGGPQNAVVLGRGFRPKERRGNPSVFQWRKYLRGQGTERGGSPPFWPRWVYFLQRVKQHKVGGGGARKGRERGNRTAKKRGFSNSQTSIYAQRVSQGAAPWDVRNLISL